MKLLKLVCFIGHYLPSFTDSEHQELSVTTKSSIRQILDIAARQCMIYLFIITGQATLLMCPGKKILQRFTSIS